MMIRIKGPSDLNAGVVDMQPATLDDFSEALARLVGRPVINRTGIAGTFAIYVEFALDLGTPGLVPPPDAPRLPASDDQSSAPSIFSAIQEQLGLKLNSTRGPSEVLIIDRVDRPSEN
jgi:bla regulator protein blaR1